MPLTGGFIPADISTEKMFFRRPKIKVLIDRWDFATAEKGKLDTIDITNYITSYSFSKSLRSPMGSCSISTTPLMFELGSRNLKHVVNMFNTMDVVRIYEFDNLKFQGYIKNIGATQSMAASGKPERSAQITANHMGGIMQEATIGFEVLAMRIKEIDKQLGGFESRIIAMANALADKIGKTGANIGDIIGIVVHEWFTLLDGLGASAYRNYLDTYLDFETGFIQFKVNKVLPSDLSFFYSSLGGQMSLWTEIQKLAEAPFNEIFFDEGPRTLWQPFADVKSASPMYNVSMSAEKTYLIGRPTPFNESLRTGTTMNYFNDLPLKILPLDWVIRIDLNKSSDEVSSLYCTVPMYTAFNELSLLVQGFAEVDEVHLNKYLLRPMIMRLFYATVSQNKSTGVVNVAQSFKREMENATSTLKNWYKNNDQMLSGVVVVQTPEDMMGDYYIGEKIKFDGVDGYFYIEGVTHRWSYGGKLESHLTVTRGWNYEDDSPIDLNNNFYAGAYYPTARNEEFTKGAI